MNHCVITAAASFVGLGVGQAAKPEVAASATRPTPVVSVRWTDPVWLVFRDVTVPYWRVGPLFGEVRAYMAEHQLSGPLFLRYIESPLQAQGASIHCQIGFMNNGEHTPLTPYRTARRGREKVAVMTITGRPVNSRRDFEHVLQSLGAQGHRAKRSYWEIYSDEPDRTVAAKPTTRIEVSLGDAQQDHGRHSSPADLGSGDRVANAPRTARLDVPRAAREDPEPRPESQRAVNDTRRLKPISALLEGGEYDCIASQLMPDAPGVPEHLRIWVGQVVFRVDALARASERMTTTDASLVVALADALVRRHDQVAGSLRASPLDQPVTSVPPTAQADARQAEQIMRDIDILLGRLAIRIDDPGGIAGELADILQRTRNLIRGRPRGESCKAGE